MSTVCKHKIKGNKPRERDEEELLENQFMPSLHSIKCLSCDCFVVNVHCKKSNQIKVQAIEGNNFYLPYTQPHLRTWQRQCRQHHVNTISVRAFFFFVQF